MAVAPRAAATPVAMRSTPACVANAVADALGIVDIELPLNPARVRTWIEEPERPPSTGTSAGVAAGDARTGAGGGIEGGGEVEIAAKPGEIWDLLLDPEQMARIVPGCEFLEVVGENAFQGVFMLGAGPVKGRFEARIDMVDLDRPNRAVLTGWARGPLGSSRGRGTIELSETALATRVRYTYAVELSGTVASVGGRLIQGAARHLIDRFLKGLARQADGETDAAPHSETLMSRLLALVWGRR